MFAYHPGDEVAVQVATTGKGNGKPTVWKMGTVVFVGEEIRRRGFGELQEYS